jgi:hypothetical protein
MSNRTRAEAQRRAARLAEQQAQARRQRRTRFVVSSVALVLAAAAVTAAVVSSRGSEDPTAPAAGALFTGPPPWPSKTDGLATRLAGLGFPPPGDESYHAHALLSVYRNGEQVPVPINMGFGRDGSHSSLHTHTPDGVIHMEADDPYPYQIGHVFTVWGVALEADRLGGDTTDGANKVHVYVNGKPAPDGPATVIKDGDNVVVAYGEEGSFPIEPDDSALKAA